MFNFIHKEYARYYAFCDEKVAACQTNGFLRTAVLNRIRWLGFFPEVTVIYNFSVQSLIADLMNIRLVQLRPRLPKSARPVHQGHDALCLEVKSGADAHLTERLVQELWDEPVYIPTSGRMLKMPIERKHGGRLSDF